MTGYDIAVDSATSTLIPNMDMHWWGRVPSKEDSSNHGASSVSRQLIGVLVPALFWGGVCAAQPTAAVPVVQTCTELHTDLLSVGSRNTFIETVDKKVQYLKNVFGLRTTELAAIMNVERPTVYHWISGASEPQAKNRARIEQLRSLAEEWAKRSQSSIRRYLHEQVGNGFSLFDLLSRDAIDADQVRKVFDDISRDTEEMSTEVTRPTAKLADGAQPEWITGF